jgi:formylglycine-generating enzyme required for sulfatase activity
MSAVRSNWILWLLVLSVVAVGSVSYVVHVVTTRSIVLVRTVPSGVKVLVDGRTVGVTADSLLAFEVDPGDVDLVFEREGFLTHTSSLSVRRGEVLEIEQQMQRPGMVFVRGGRFEMGTDAGAYNEKPAHRIFLTPFYIDTREVTVRAFQSRYASYEPVFTDPDLPATGISWEEAEAFCRESGKRLPSEAEWERACRGPGGNEYAYGSEFDSTRGRTGAGVSDGPVSVASYPAGNAGAFDMTGNVWEWSSDWYGRDYYRVSPARNPTGPEAGDRHVLRGGAWYSNASFSKCTHRPGNIRSERDRSFGFRCAQDLN